jgi:ribonucleoside-triphosphate reductase
MEKERTKCEIYARCVGYIRPIDNWNDGKVEEYKSRRNFDYKTSMESPCR